MLKIEGLSKAFGATRALDGIDMTIERGQMVGIVGRSGAGKSTLLRTINRLTTTSRGRIEYGGEDVTLLQGRRLREWRRRCAMVFQQFNLVQRLDALDNVLVGRVSHKSTLRTLFKIYTPAERALAVMMLKRVGLAEQILQRADTLSGGQQQRVAIARALLQKPEIVLADEPIASLDPHNAQLVMEALRAINREEGLTVITNVHTLQTARDYCDRVIGMSLGKVVYDGSPQGLSSEVLQDIYGQPADARPGGGGQSLEKRQLV